MTLRDRFRALFSPTRRWAAGADAPIQRGGWLGPSEIVLPRADCQYRRFDFSTLTPAQRGPALALAAERAAVEVGGRWVARRQDGIAHVWLVGPEMAAALDPAAILIAESALRAAPSQGSACRLVALAEGVEGQVWRDGVLGASRWWPQAPSHAAWTQFLRSASMAADSAPPPLEVAPLTAAPWGRSEARLPWSETQLERAFWRLTVVIFGVVLGWQLLASAVWSFSNFRQTSELNRLRSESMPLIEAREAAEAARDRMDALAALTRTPDDYVLIADVRRALPEDARLTGWYRDAGRLRVELQSASADPRVFVQAFRDHPLLNSVVANPGEAGRMNLEVDLDATPAEAMP